MTTNDPQRVGTQDAGGVKTVEPGSDEERWALLLADAIAFALKAHARQVDRAGRFYGWHLLRVSERGWTWEEHIVGVLHDVLEDTSTTVEDLRDRFPAEIVAAVVLLTRRPDQTYAQFIAAISTNALARQVKLFDLGDNLNPLRSSSLPNSLRERYEKAQRILEAADDAMLDALDERR